MGIFSWRRGNTAEAQAVCFWWRLFFRSSAFVPPFCFRPFPSPIFPSVFRTSLLTTNFCNRTIISFFLAQVHAWLFNLSTLATAVVSTSCFQGIEGGISSVEFLPSEAEGSTNFVIGTTLGTVVCCAVEGYARCVELARGKVPSSVRCLLLPDGIHLILGCGDGTVRVLRVTDADQHDGETASSSAERQRIVEVEGGTWEAVQGGCGGVFDLCPVCVEASGEGGEKGGRGGGGGGRGGRGEGGGKTFTLAVAGGDGSLVLYKIQ